MERIGRGGQVLRERGAGGAPVAGAQRAGGVEVGEQLRRGAVLERTDAAAEASSYRPATNSNVPARATSSAGAAPSTAIPRASSVAAS